MENPAAWPLLRRTLSCRYHLYGRAQYDAEPVDCATGASLGAGTVANGALKFSGGRYTWTWSTQRSWAGTCRALTMDFAVGDGLAIQLFVRFS